MMVKDNVKTAVRQILTNYLDQNHRRKTPERFAILDAIYEFCGHFTFNDLANSLEAKNFHVSKATLYNTLNLFMAIRLVVGYDLMGNKIYEASYSGRNHIRQMCTECGKITEINSPQITAVIEEARLKRFQKDNFTLYIYGTCSICKAKKTRRKNKNNIK